MPHLLIFDTEQFKITGVYTLYTPDKQKSFTFKDALAAKAFVIHYTEKPINAQFAYVAGMRGAS